MVIAFTICLAAFIGDALVVAFLWSIRPNAKWRLKN